MQSACRDWDLDDLSCCKQLHVDSLKIGDLRVIQWMVFYWRRSFSRQFSRRAMADEKMSSTMDRIGGSLINAILGGLILWVGQTTVRHAGVLAGVDEKFAGINEQFVDVDRRQEDLKAGWKKSQRDEGQRPVAVHDEGRRQADCPGAASGANHE